MNKALKIILIVTISFGLFYFLRDLAFPDFRTWLNERINNIVISQLITYFLVGIPLFIGVLLIHNFRNFFDAVGINRSIVNGVVFPLICTLPMLIGYAAVFEFDSEITFIGIATGAVFAAFFEELYYRSILFGQIFRFTRIGFIPAIFFGALLFGFGHVYQSQDLSTMIMIFVTTFMGAVLFAWVYVEWQYNLWVPVFLHLFMNLFWMMFSVSDNAFGGLYSNIFRAITIAMAIILTIIYKKRNGLKLEVNRQTLWMRKMN